MTSAACTAAYPEAATASDIEPERIVRMLLALLHLLCWLTTTVTGPWSEDVKSKIGEAHGSGAPFC